MNARQNFIAVKTFMFGYETKMTEVNYTEPRKKGEKHVISCRMGNYRLTVTFEEDGDIDIKEVPGRNFKTRDCRVVNSIISREVTQIIIKEKHDYFRRNKYFGLPRF